MKHWRLAIDDCRVRTSRESTIDEYSIVNLLLVLLISSLWLVEACGPRRPALLPVALPDLSRADEGVQKQARERYAALTARLGDSSVSAADLSLVFGELGMVLQAADFQDVAEPCYLNAQTLAPTDVRWPYYLAGLYKSKGDVGKAEAAYKRALDLRPDDLATLIWLGRLELDQGRPDDAEPLFTRALAQAPRTVAALAGLGRVAVARRDYAAAARHLEEALALDPDAESLHAPLAVAYRGLGQLEKAEPHQRQWRNRDVYVPDPLGEELDLLLESGLSYELRGVRAFEARDWDAAARFFRKGIALAKDNSPLTRSLHHKLGTALFLSGDSAAAEQQFEEVVRLAPADGIDESAAKAHYSLGVLREEKGQQADAVAHLTAAVKYQPNYVEAHLALADALRRGGRMQDALTHYQEAIRINPRSTPARLGTALALVGLHRYAAASDWLAEQMKRDPDRPEFALAAARLLAAAPDDRVRDGRTALAIAQKVFQQQKSTDVGEAMAMARAEMGDFDEAVRIQRDIMTAAEKAGLTTAVKRMAENLRKYERRLPCREPWPNDVPVVLSDSPVQADGVRRP